MYSFLRIISTPHCTTWLQENLANKKLSSFFWDLHKEDCQCSNSNFQIGLTSCPLLSQSILHTDLIPGYQRYLAVILDGRNVFPLLTKPKMEMFLNGSEKMKKKRVINQCFFQAVRYGKYRSGRRCYWQDGHTRSSHEMYHTHESTTFPWMQLILKYQ